MICYDDYHAIPATPDTQLDEPGQHIFAECQGTEKVKCRETICCGDEYYNIDGLILCKSCGEIYLEYLYKRTAGE